MHWLSGDLNFLIDGMEVLARLAVSDSETHGTILDSGIFPLIRASLERWPSHDSLNERIWQLLVLLMWVGGGSRKNHWAAEDGVRLQVIENGLMPYSMVSFLRRCTVFTIYAANCTLGLLLLLTRPSQHFAQIEHVFLSSASRSTLSPAAHRKRSSRCRFLSRYGLFFQARMKTLNK